MYGLLLVCCDINFSVLEKNIILLFERNNPIITILLKDISKP